MEFGCIRRELYIDASPETVFDVVARPELVGRGGPTESFAVVDARPPHTFSFRWTHPAGRTATEGNSLLVTFHLAPSGDGTLLRLTETGFRKRGWEPDVLEGRYRDHLRNWDVSLPRLARRAEALEVRRLRRLPHADDPTRRHVLVGSPVLAAPPRVIPTPDPPAAVMVRGDHDP
ncbi:SRPBCC domain-containing protein [Streptomyces sp. NPDC026672]|uniref:SRPBCC domain-containing protein n=1 Tax=unclassified Streptomyces TaxID=2593676 RepID=UPI0033F0C537